MKLNDDDAKEEIRKKEQYVWRNILLIRPHFI
jgi:hypothetical protein